MHAESQRTQREILTDKALLLCLFCLSSKVSELRDMLKAQKLSCLVAIPLFWENKKALSLEFYRYHKGPMSNGVYGAIDDFDKLQLMRRNQYQVSEPSERAQEFAKEFVKEVLLGIKPNRFCYDQIESVVKHYAKYDGDKLCNLVYGLPFKTLESTELRLVKYVPKLEHFSYALDDDEATHKLTIPESWFDTLAILLSPSNYESLIRAEQSPNAET